MNNELVVKINPAKILQAQKDGQNIVFDPNAEKSIIKLLDMQREVNEAVEWLKSEIERQALEYNDGFSSIKGERLKINYSASGAKYRDDGTVKTRRARFWNKKTVWSINSKAVDEFRASRHVLPTGIIEAPRKKTIRITVSEDSDE